jgi:hypothetical protein
MNRSSHNSQNVALIEPFFTANLHDNLDEAFGSINSVPHRLEDDIAVL